MKKEITNSGIGLTGIIWVGLIIFKIYGLLNWNWILVILFPVWLPFAFICASLVLIIALGLIALVGFVVGVVIYAALRNLNLIAP